MKMKKLVVSLAMSVAMLTAVPVFANDIRVIANNEEVVFEGQGPVIVDGRTLVPVRDVFEALGFEVVWHSQSRQAVLTNSMFRVVVTIDSNWLDIDRMSSPLDVPAQIINGATMIPIRAILEGTGHNVDFDNGTIIIRSLADVYNLAELESQLFERINIHRAEHGLAPFELHKNLTEYAREHAYDMVKYNLMDNNNGSDGSNAFQRITRAGLDMIRADGNSMRTRSTDVDAMFELIMSNETRANLILDEFITNMGLAIAVNNSSLFHIVQKFGTPADEFISGRFSHINSEFEQRIFEAINQERISRGLRPLQIDIGLNDAARWRAEHIASGASEEMLQNIGVRFGVSLFSGLRRNLGVEFTAGIDTAPEYAVTNIMNRDTISVDVTEEILRSDINYIGIGVASPGSHNRIAIFFGTGTEISQIADPFYLGRLQDEGAIPRSSITLPDRRLTESERANWIADYNRNGGASTFELEVIRLANIVRAEHGLSQLQVDDTLMMAARFYTQTLSNLDLPLGHHEGPYGGSRSTADVFGANMRWNGGNGSGGRRTPQDVIDGWMNSPGHRRYLLSPEHNFAGAGTYLGGRFGVFNYLLLSEHPSN